MIISRKVTGTFFFTTLAILFCVHGSAQQNIHVSYDYGRILEHTPKIRDLIRDPAGGFSVNYTFPVRVDNHWRQHYNFADFGLAYDFMALGYPEVLGNAHAIKTFVKVPVVDYRRVFMAGIKGAAGAAYFKKTYHANENPDNNAISTHINFTSELGLFATIRLAPVYFEYALGITHFSNGLLKAPNLGINVLKNRLALGIILEEPELEINTDQNELAVAKNELWIYGSFGLKEIENQSETYNVENLSVNYGRQLGRINRIGAGVDIIRDNSLTTYAVLTYGYDGVKNLNVRVGPNIQGEFLFGKVSLTGAYGFYFGDTANYISARYYKIGLKYRAGSFHGLAQIRAVPLFRADVIEVGLGYTLLAF